MNHKTKTILIVMAAALATAAPGLAVDVEYYLRADVFTKTMPDGNDVTMWGFALDSDFDSNDGEVNVPGPLLTVPTGDTRVIVHMKNNLTPEQTGLPMGCPVSLVIPGQHAAMTPVRFGEAPYPQFEGRIRSLTHETPPGNRAPVDYIWENFKPGTYVYHSGTHIQCHVQMGLYGGIVKDHAATPYKQAYPNVIYETSVPVFFSEIDPAFHAAVASNNYGPDKAMTSTIDYEPKYFLINGRPFVPGQPVLPAGVHGGGTLLRLFNMGLQNRSPLLQGSYMTVVAEDGQPYKYPRQQYAALLPAGKALDAIVAFPAAGDYPLYDRALGLTNQAATNGGMLKHLQVGAGAFWPVITAITATPPTILDTQASQIQVNVTDQDTAAASLVYTWEVPPGAGTLDNANIANPVFTPAYTATTVTHTLKVTVSDGAGSPRVDIATVAVTVEPTPTPPVATLYEAEDALVNGVNITSAITGFTGTGYVDYVHATSDYIQWTVNVATAGSYNLTFRYASSSNRPLALAINGTVVTPSMSFPSTGGFTVWGTVSTVQALNAGVNTIRTTATGLSGGNVDHLEVTAP